MKKQTQSMVKRFFAVLMLLVMTLGVTVRAQEPESPGEITPEFISAASSLIRSNWEDEYFSSITMKLGSDIMLVDGEETEITPPVLEGDQLILPVEEIAEAIGAEPQSHREGLRSFASQEPTFDSFGLTAHLHGDTVTITKPYQMKQLVVQTRNNRDLHNFYGAEQFVTNGYGLYLLQYSSIEDIRAAHEALRLEGNVLYALPNQVVRLYDDELPLSEVEELLPWDEEPPSTPEEIPTAEEEPSADGNLGGYPPAALNLTSGAALSITYPLPDLDEDDRWGVTRIFTDIFKQHLIDNNKTDDLIVAVIDTGLDTTHPHFKDRTVTGIDITDSKNLKDDMSDGYGHGTHVAGTIVDCTPDNVKIMPVRVLDDDGRITDEFSISMGVQWAADNKAAVINMSLGLYCLEDDCLEKRAVDYAVEKGVCVVASAGNDASDTAVKCPAKLDNVVTVAATDVNDIAADFSNYGDEVDVSAPGVSILSSVPGDGEESWDGTSMASPHAAAAAALLKLQNPELKGLELKEALCETTVDLGKPGKDRRYGAGVVDMRMALGVDKEDVPAEDLYFSEYEYETFFKTQNPTTLRLYPIVTPWYATGKSLTITSSDNTIAEYDYDKGVLTIKSPGTVTVTAVTANGKEASCRVDIGGSKYWIDYAADSYAGGDGSEENPYLIGTPEQLAKMARAVVMGEDLQEGKWFRLISDIDLSGWEWTPVHYEETGVASTMVLPFMGNFDGNFHAIRNMTITQSPFEGKTYEAIGLFGGVYGSVIKNLAVLDANIEKLYKVRATGILAGEVAGGNDVKTEITGCYTTGKSSGAGFIGGLVTDDQTEQAIVISNCYSGAESRYGGFFEEINGSGVLIRNVYAKGAVTSDSVFGGGLGDALNSDAMIVNSFASNHPETGYGFLADKQNGSIEKCYYLSGNQQGIGDDNNPSDTDLTPKDISFFKNRDNFTQNDYWSDEYPWDFENVWAMDEAINDGLPVLRGLFTTNLPVIKTNPADTSAVSRSSSVLVTLSSDTPGAAIYYTTDGSEVTKEARLYTQPFAVSYAGSDTVVIKAKVFKDGMLESDTSIKNIRFAGASSGGGSDRDSGGSSGGATSSSPSSSGGTGEIVINTKDIDTKKDRHTVEITPKDGKSSAMVPLSVLTDIQDKTKLNIRPFTLEIETPCGSYIIPADLAEMIPGLAGLLEENKLRNDEVGIRITVTDKYEDESLLQTLEGQITNGSLFALVDFQMDIVNLKTGKVMYTADAFNKPIERTIKMPGGMKKMPAFWGAFKLDGERLQFVPHKEALEDGVLYVSISSRTNSVYAVAENHVSFTDVTEGFWGKAFIESAGAKGLVHGTGNGLFQPQKSVTRAEFVQMAVNALCLPDYDPDLIGYNDVDKNEWYYEAVMKAKSANLLTGFDGGIFEPTKPITREEMVSVIAAAARQAGVVTTMEYLELDAMYDDYDLLDDRFANDMQLVIKLKIMQGISARCFDPKGVTTRAQAATVLMNMTKAFGLI